MCRHDLGSEFDEGFVGHDWSLLDSSPTVYREVERRTIVTDPSHCQTFLANLLDDSLEDRDPFPEPAKFLVADRVVL